MDHYYALKQYVQGNNLYPAFEGSYHHNQQYPVIIGADNAGMQSLEQGVIEAVLVMPLVLWDDEHIAYHIEGTLDQSMRFSRGRIIDDLAHPQRPSKFDPSPFAKMMDTIFSTAHENGWEYRPEYDPYNFNEEIFVGDARGDLITGTCVDWYYNRPEPNTYPKATFELRRNL